VILSGRNVNDSISKFVASKVIYLMKQKSIPLKGSKALILGVTFKENFNDIRNSKVPQIYRALKNEGLQVEVHDPIADPEKVKKEYGITLINIDKEYEAIILAVAHQDFLLKGIGKYKNPKGAVVYDIKSVLEREVVDGRL
jgi:UDP-N-acetyl-D-galactosamine dehydrogenase